MPSGSYRQVHVQCPYYKYDDGRKRVTCEGLVDESSIALIYRRAEDYRRQMEVFCCRNWDKCEVYRMLAEKYEES